MTFAQPELLYLLLWLPVLAGLGVWSAARRRWLLRQLSDEPSLGRAVDAPPSHRRLAGELLGLAGVGLLILALARPQFGSRLELVEQRGMDIMIALDISSSMLARDIAPSRLEKAKLAVADLLGQVPTANVGLVVFAGQAFVQFPLTTDQEAVRMLLDAAGVESVSQPGTAIGEGLRQAIQSFDERSTRHKIILLLTDGEDHETDPLEAARQAAESGIPVYVLGFGKPEGEPIPLLDENGRVTDYKKDGAGQVVMSRLDEETLQEIARLTDGQYYRATPSGKEIAELSERIAGMEQNEAQGQFQVQKVERFQIPLGAGLLALAAEWALRDRRRPWLKEGAR